jgi:hypothetical protein
MFDVAARKGTIAVELKVIWHASKRPRQAKRPWGDDHDGSSAASGTEARNGHMIGRHAVCPDSSWITNEYHASSTLMAKSVIITGKKRKRYETRSIVPFLRCENFSHSMSVRTCAPLSSA